MGQTAGFVGRRTEIDVLTRHIATGEAAILAIVGDHGMGKTALARYVISQQSGSIWWAKTAAWEMRSPGGVLHQLFQQAVPDSPGAAASLVCELITAGTGESQIPFVVIDDADYADEMSLQTLVSVVRHNRAIGTKVLLTVTDAQSFAARVASDVIVMKALDGTDIAELATNIGVAIHPKMADALCFHTRGNPRHAVALLHELPSTVWAQPGTPLPAPAHVVKDVSDRLDRCGSQGRALIEAMAILGRHGSLREATELGAIDSPLAAIDEAVATGLITDVLEPWPSHEVELRSPLLAAAVLTVMGKFAAGKAHERAAAVVAPNPVRSLMHRVRATMEPDATLADGLEEIANERASRGAWADAATLFREACRFSRDPDLQYRRLARTADSLVAAGDVAGALSIVPSLDSLHETPRRDGVLAYLAIVRGRAAEAEVRLGRAWDAVQLNPDAESAALIAQRYVLHSLSRCRGAEIVKWADRALSLADQNSSTRNETEGIRGLGLGLSGRSEQAAEAYRDLSRSVPHGVQAQGVSLGHGWLQLAQDDLDGARSSLETTVAAADMGGSARMTLWAYGWLARVHFITGDWDQALRTVEQGKRLSESSGIVLAVPLTEWTHAQIHSLRGNWEGAQAALRSAEWVTEGYEVMRVPVHLARAQIAETAADYGAVVRAMDPIRKMSPGTSLDQPGFWPWADVLANALILEGKLDEAGAFLETHERMAQEAGHRSSLARLGYARGRLFGAIGDVHGARRTFEQALAQIEELPLFYDRARINLAYGQTLRRAGKRREAEPILASAREIFLWLGAQTYVDRCDRELRASGVYAKLPRGELGLTPQEDAVVKLVAQGLSNREVATELYVSPKTVQYHLTRIYAKLGIRSRVELAKLYG